MSPKTQRGKLIPRLIAVGASVVLVVAMLFNTKFLTPEEVEALTPDEFSSEETAQELYASVQSEVTEGPVELSEVAAALDDDPEAAAGDFDAQPISEGTVVYAVVAEGSVEDASADNLMLSVDGISQGRQIVMPLTSALDGNLIRDLSGFGFGDAPGQTDYQRVGTEIGSLLRADAQEAVGEDPDSLIGTDIRVEGLLRYVDTDAGGADERPLIIQPLNLEVGP